jgi:hypothetical protein
MHDAVQQYSAYAVLLPSEVPDSRHLIHCAVLAGLKYIVCRRVIMDTGAGLLQSTGASLGGAALHSNPASCSSAQLLWHELSGVPPSRSWMSSGFASATGMFCKGRQAATGRQ